MRFVCDSCRAQYMISDEKIGAKGVKVRCKKCGHVILVRRAQSAAPEETPTDALNAVNRAEDESTASSEANAEGISSPLAGIADDEIGAVFDSVLSTSNQKTVEASASESSGGSDEDALSTRVLDEDEVKKLAADSAGDSTDTLDNSPTVEAPTNGVHAGNGAHGTYSNGSNGVKATNGAYATNGVSGAGSVPQQDWFIAIDDRQVGPISLDELKTRWEKGEVGPDSLCWRAGFADWLPLSEVAVLRSALTPQPKRAAVAPAAAVVSVPVESSYNIGGVSRTVRSEVPVAAAAAAAEETAWKPSAASALASLVKQEIEALTKPAPAPKVEPEEKKVRGIFDAPVVEAPAPREVVRDEPRREEIRPGPGTRAPMPTPAPGVPRAPEAAPAVVPEQPAFVPPHAASAYNSGVHSGVHPVVPKAGHGMLVGALVVMTVLVAAVGLLAYRVLVQPPPQQIAAAPVVPAAAPAAAPAAQPAAPAPTAAAPAPAQPAAPESSAPAAAAPAAAAPAQPAQPVAAPPTQPAAGVAPKAAAIRPSAKIVPPTGTGRLPAVGARRGDGDVITPSREERQERHERRGGANSDDEFDQVFGTSGIKRDEPRKETKPPPNRGDSVYVPPPPGSADIPARLGQSDIMSVVLSNKPAILKCKQPGVSGKLVVRWTIKTNGRTSNVTVLTDELKGSPLAACITGLVKSWKFPAHRVQGDPVDFPFNF